MIRELEIRLAPAALAEPGGLAAAVVRRMGVPSADVEHVAIVRRALDARTPPPVWVLRVRTWIGEPFVPTPLRVPAWRDVRHAPPAVIVGAGPAGLFAALRLLELGVRPLVLERGRAVRGRRHDVAVICRGGPVDPDSNYCFGEGGAGTFSDGKLYTRATKRGDVRRILEILVHHGAPPDILVDAQPHVGTNRLPQVVEALRATIVAHGGEVRFGTRVTGLCTDGEGVTGVVTAGAERVDARAVILATGHSARDVYTLLQRAGIALEAKPFAVGVRVEHPQTVIDAIQYHCADRSPLLPPAAYRIAHRVGDRGVFSFCMCPGGVICPAATAGGEVVVNGWSPSSRRLRFANAGIVVEVRPGDLAPFAADGPLAGVAFQAALEHAAWTAGGGALVAPAQRLGDFVAGRAPADLPACSYPPGVGAADLAAVLPAAIHGALCDGLRAIGRRLRGYLTNEAVVVGVESRTSAPVRIPRDPVTLVHPQVRGLYPCGEGAGAAGGIVSAAMDGERVATALAAAS